MDEKITEIDECNGSSRTEASTKTAAAIITTSRNVNSHNQNGSTKQLNEANDDTSLGSKKVYKKTSADNKLVLYLCERDLVIRDGKINKLHGVLVVDTEYLDKQQIIGQISLTFRYGREDEEVMGLKFCNEAIMCLTQLYPPYPSSCDRPESGDSGGQSRNPVQTALLKRLGTNAFPFTMEITPLAPPSVQLLPVKEYNGAQIGTCYEIRAYLADYVDEKKYRNKMVRMGIRVTQVPTIQQKRINRDWLEKRHLFRMLHKGGSVESGKRSKAKETVLDTVSAIADVKLKNGSDDADNAVNNIEDDEDHDDDDGEDGYNHSDDNNEDKEAVKKYELNISYVSKTLKAVENEEEEKGTAKKFLRPFLRRNFSDFKNKKRRENEKSTSAEAPPTASPPSLLRSASPPPTPPPLPQQKYARPVTSSNVHYEKKEGVVADESDLSPSSGTIDKPFLLSDGRIQLHAGLNKSAYKQNEPINVSLTITNNSNKTVRRIKISVVQNVDVCMFSNGKFKNVLNGQTGKDMGPIGPGRTFSKTYQIRAQNTNAAKNWIALEDCSSFGQRGTTSATATNTAGTVAPATPSKIGACVTEGLARGNGIPLSPTVMPYSARNFDEPNVFSIYVSYYVQVKVLMSKMMMSSRHLTIKLPFILLPSVGETKAVAAEAAASAAPAPTTNTVTLDTPESVMSARVAEKIGEEVTSCFNVDVDVHYNS